MALRALRAYVSVSGPSIFLLIRSYDEARNVFAVIVSINLVVIVLGIIVNAAICYVMVRRKRYKRNGSNFFIMHLSVMELTYRFLVFTIIISFAVPTTGIKSIQCKAIPFFSETCTSAIFVRYQNIVHPLKTLKSKKKPVLLVFLVWLYAVCCRCVLSFCYQREKYFCSRNSRSSWHVLRRLRRQETLRHTGNSARPVLNHVPLVVISVLYTKIVLFLHKRSHEGMMNKLAARSKTKAVRMLIVIVIAYVLSLGPAVIFSVLRSYGVFNNTSFDVMLLTGWWNLQHIPAPWGIL